MTTTLLHIAWRNLWRNRRRSLISIAAISFTLVIIAVVRALQHGTHDTMKTFSIGLFTGDLQVHRAGYQAEQTLAYSMSEEERDWQELLSRSPWTTAFSRRLVGFGLASSDSLSTGVALVGIEPQAERDVSSFSWPAATGRALRPDDDNIVLLGDGLAQNLGISVGDSVAVLTEGYQSQMGAGLYAIVGLVRTGSPDVDQSTVIMPLSTAQVLFSMPGRFTHLVLRTEDSQRAEAHALELRETLSDDAYEVLSWTRLMPELSQAIRLDNVRGALILGFLLLLVGVEVFNTTMTSVLERVKEFGVLQSLGMKPRQISLLVFLELTLTLALALGGGLLVAWIVVNFLNAHPIPLMETAGQFKFGVTGLEFTRRPIVFVESVIAVTVVSLLAMLYPVLKVRGFSPVEALRYV